MSGYAWNGKVRPWFPLRWDQLTAPMKSYACENHASHIMWSDHILVTLLRLGIRWAFAVGNHDDQGDFNRYLTPLAAYMAT